MTEQELLTQCYHRMYQGMVQKDSLLLEDTLDDFFVLVHMTGMRQSKRQYIDAIVNGTLNYYSEQTDGIDITVEGDTARLVGRSSINAAVFGGGRHIYSKSRKTPVST